MSQPIILTEEKWNTLYEKLKKDYPLSVVLIRPRMREVLGFLPRSHEEWSKRELTIDRRDVGFHTMQHIVKIHLDFYDEKKRTMFLLKYTDYV